MLTLFYSERTPMFLVFYVLSRSAHSFGRNHISNAFTHFHEVVKALSAEVRVLSDALLISVHLFGAVLDNALERGRLGNGTLGQLLLLIVAFRGISFS